MDKKIAAEEIKSILAGKDRRLAGMTAPACGLVLWKVFYKAKQKHRTLNIERRTSNVGDDE